MTWRRPQPNPLTRIALKACAEAPRRCLHLAGPPHDLAWDGPSAPSAVPPASHLVGGGGRARRVGSQRGSERAGHPPPTAADREADTKTNLDSCVGERRWVTTRSLAKLDLAATTPRRDRLRHLPRPSDTDLGSIPCEA
jgi:hypothetical protein